MLTIAREIDVSPTRVHTAYVYFSSGDDKKVLIDLATLNTYDEFANKINMTDFRPFLPYTNVFE